MENEDPKPFRCVPAVLGVLLNFSSRMSVRVSPLHVSLLRVSPPRMAPRVSPLHVSPACVSSLVSPRMSPALRVLRCMLARSWCVTADLTSSSCRRSSLVSLIIELIESLSE
jgi:hypothetical protein